MKHIVQFSGGKDSTCMLLMMIEREMPIDEIIYCDTGKEFPQMYDHISKVEKHIGRKVTVLRVDHSFDYYFAEYIKVKGKSQYSQGYGWPTLYENWGKEINLQLKSKLAAQIRDLPVRDGVECI